MKLLTEVMNQSEVVRIQALFDIKGIPIFVGNADTARNVGFIYPTGKFSIFVVHEPQFEEAQKLLDDESHEVKNPIDMVEYQRITESTSADSRGKLFRSVILIGAALFGALAIAAIIAEL